MAEALVSFTHPDGTKVDGVPCDSQGNPILDEKAQAEFWLDLHDRLAYFTKEMAEEMDRFVQEAHDQLGANVQFGVFKFYGLLKMKYERLKLELEYAVKPYPNLTQMLQQRYLRDDFSYRFLEAAKKLYPMEFAAYLIWANEQKEA